MAQTARLLRLAVAGIMLAPAVCAQVAGNTPYLDAARQADTIDDGLTRCLAYPDLPGQRWPDGHAAALCQQAYTAPITLQDIREHLERGQIVKLDALFKRDLERHFAPQASEIVHRDFAAIDASSAADTLTQRWIGRAPGSAYANAARARHLLLQATVLRGPRRLDDLSPDQVEAVQQLAERALDLLGRAVRLEARLIHVHVELAELGLLLGRADIIEGAHQRGAALDPGCSALAGAMMAMLRQAGEAGSAGMRAYASGLQEQLARRPQLATVMALPALFDGQAQLADGKHKEAFAALRDAARQGASSEALALLAKAMANLPGRDRAERLQVLLQAGRFGGDEMATDLERGRALLRAGEHQWALRSLARTLSQNPGHRDVHEVHQLLALTNSYLKQYAEAERHLLKVMAYPPARAFALHSLVMTMRQAGEWTKTAQYAAMMVREQPQVLEGWRMLGAARFRSGDKAGALAAFESFLKRVDHLDASMAPGIRWTRQAIAWIRDPDGEESRPPDL